jgi:polyferredoxin
MAAIPLEPDPSPAPSARPPKKKLDRRTDRDLSQQLRLGFQLAFIALNVWIGVQFYLWVRHFETGGATVAVSRPAGVEGWLPIAALMNLKAWIFTGVVPELHPAGMFILVAFLAMSLLLKKAFCSWLCPIGTISEYLWKLGRKVAKENLVAPRWVDLPLRSLKYILLGFFLWAVVRMSPEDINAFLQSPYGLVADVKMMNFFRFMGTTALIVIAALVALSVAIQNFWCRYLCPYGALLGIVALFSPARIRRDADACIDCAKCAKVCPARLPVDVKPQIRSAECALCMACVAVCPAKGALEVKVTKRRTLPSWAVAAAIAALFLGIVGTARLTGHWDTNLPDAVYQYLIPRVEATSHP